MNDVVDGYMFEVTTTSGTSYFIVTKDNDMAVAINLVKSKIESFIKGLKSLCFAIKLETGEPINGYVLTPTIAD